MSLVDANARVHIVGIGGAGMSAIAIVLAQQGRRVSGSDLKPSLAFDRLRSHGIKLEIGHRAENAEGSDMVAVSSAIPSSNPEIRWAREHGVPVVTRSELLPMIISEKYVIGVAGTHGKSTTTSMLALSLLNAGRMPSFIVGGELNEIGTNALWNEGRELVIEADESDGTFLHLGCSSLVVTNLEPDHLDYYGTYDALKSAFRRFVLGAAGPKVVCADSPDAAFLVGMEGVSSFGFSHLAHYRIFDFTTSKAKTLFKVSSGDGDACQVELAVPGRHNALNAAATVAMCSELGVDPDAVTDALCRFTGVARRYQYRGEYNGAVLVDDYAHLPGEVAVVLETAAAQGYERVIAIFQPHRYTRTAALYKEFAQSLAGADVVVVTDVYAAGEMPIPGITGQLISSRLKELAGGKEVHYFPHRQSLAPFIQSILREGDICLTLGAGDLTTLYGEMSEGTLH